MLRFGHCSTEVPIYDGDLGRAGSDIRRYSSSIYGYHPGQRYVLQQSINNNQVVRLHYATTFWAAPQMPLEWTEDTRNMGKERNFEI